MGRRGSRPYFRSDPTKGQRSSRGQIALNALWPPNLVRRTPDWSVVHCWGQRSHRSHLESTGGQNAQKCPMANEFGRKNL